MTPAGDVEPPAGSVLRELIEHGLLTVADAVERGLAMEEMSISHRSFQVRVGDEPRLFVKRADRVRSQGRDLHAEAAVYRLARSTPALADVTPGCRLISADEDLIVLEAVPAGPLEMLIDPSGRAPDASVLRSYGRAVARTHSVLPAPFGRPPWLLLALEPGWGGYTWLPEPCRRLLLSVAGSPTFCSGFRAAREAWSASGLVHGDLRSSNVLVMLDGDRPRVWLVDWELACRGDAAWDLAAVLADLLAATLSAARPDPIFDVTRAAALFLSGYHDVARLTPDAWIDLLGRSVRLAGVRLIQTLVEYGHVSEADLNAAAPVMLPWAAGLLEGPAFLSRELARSASGSADS